jgi:hypothetical protein
MDFDVVIKDLVSALTITTSAKNLKKIILNNQDDDYEANVTDYEMYALFDEDGNCGMKDMENLVGITDSRKIILDGSTMFNYQVLDLIDLGLVDEIREQGYSRENETAQEKGWREEVEVLQSLTEGLNAAQMEEFMNNL